MMQWRLADAKNKFTEVVISFKRFLLDYTPNLEGLDLSRDKSPIREVDL